MLLLVPALQAPQPRAEIAFERVQLSSEFYCEGATFADLDRDGDNEVISGPFWYEGPDSKTRHELYEPAPFDPRGYSDNFFVWPRDLDGDAWLDLLVVGFPGKEAWWFRNPLADAGARDARWERFLVWPVVDNEAPAFADLTGDGRPELVFHTAGRFGWAEPVAGDPRAAWTFRALSEDLKLGQFVHGLGVGDVDGDGRKDVLWKEGWFQQPAALAEGPLWRFHAFRFSEREGGAQMFVNDVDLDGDGDVITSLAAHHFGLSWFEQRRVHGEISFVEHRFMDDEPSDSPHGVRFGELHALALADVNGDGNLDVVTGKRWWSHGAQGDPEPGSKAVVYWFERARDKDGAIDFVPHLADDDSGVGTFLVTGDVDRDGRVDAVIGNKKGTFVLLQKEKRRAAAALSEEQKIEKLLEEVASSGLIFVRNGAEHEAKAAAKHLRSKRKRAGGDVKTARDFVEKVASRSSATGRDYEIVLAGGKRVPARQWLLERLAAIEGAAERGSVGPTLDFESGDLRGWKATGEAFAGQPIRGDTVSARRREASRHSGQYWIGGYEKHGDGPTGTLTSDPFAVARPWASFLVGGGPHGTTRVEVVLAGYDKVLFRTSGASYESLQRVAVDLRDRVGQEIFVRLVDEQSGHWGHVNFDDFRFHAERPELERDADVPPIVALDEVAHAGLSPQAAAQAMTVPDGFRVDLVAGEPEIHQPIALAIDARGRLWVAEAFTYPQRREGDEGLDDIVVFEDTDADGRFDRRTVFLEKLNLVSGLEVGFGGVWIGAAPYLLFVPDTNDDLVPDGRAEVLLDGWAWQDTHETLNAFNWGPDGWLYGCHGVFTHSRVGKPGTPDAERVPINAGVWRYHPTKREFEVFAWGTSNPWGVDFDDRGQAFITACVIPHLYHAIQGARYERQSGAHFDPYVFDDIKTIADHRHYVGADPHGGNLRSAAAGGGHAHCGAMIYLGDGFPASYRGTLFVDNIHGSRLNREVLERRGSGFVGRHAPDFLVANDRHFRGINFKYGPEGSVYLIDWYDKQACHRTEPEIWDRSNGRLYRVSYGAHRPVRVDLRAMASPELCQLLLHENDWFVRQARRILQERGPSEATHAALRGMLEAQEDETRALRSLWALHCAGGLTERIARDQLQSRHEYVRAWAVQLLCEDREVSAPALRDLEELALAPGSPAVRLYLASALQRLPLADRWQLARNLLLHAEDGEDPNLPLTLWYGVEPLVPAEPERAIALARGARIETVARYLVRRAAAEPSLHPALVRALADPHSLGKRALLLEEMQRGLAEQRGLQAPAGWAELYAELAQDPDARIRDQARLVAAQLGEQGVLPEYRRTLADRAASAEVRLLALEALVRERDAETEPILCGLLSETPAEERVLRGPVLRALAAYGGNGAARAILASYPSLSADEKRDALNTLSSRAAYAGLLLDAVETGEIARTDLGAFVARKIESLGDEALALRVQGVWGRVRPSAADKARRIAELKAALAPESLARADLPRGREVFSRTCEQCHTLFGAGGKVGPELTGSNRADLDYLLSNAVDPNAVVGQDYLATLVWMNDGRLITGIQKSITDTALTLQTENELVTVPREEIEESRLSDLSTMPEGLLDALEEEEIRDLVAYLQSPAQTPLRATPANAERFFNGLDLAGWRGDPACWLVENGEIVGRTEGLARNEFLRSELELADFRLELEVRLVGDQGNSGIQFRSREREDGGVQGYQADIGPGWWGKLYEEHGRELLSDRAGDAHVVKDGWNRYEIQARGHRIRTWINGEPCVDLEDPEGALRGIVAPQIHSGGPTEIRVRVLKLEIL